MARSGIYYERRAWLKLIEWTGVLLCWLWSHSPIFSGTDDSQYGTLNYQNWRKRKNRNRKVTIRFSIFNLCVGDTSLYLLSWTNPTGSGVRFAWFCILRLPKMGVFGESWKERDRIAGFEEKVKYEPLWKIDQVITALRDAVERENGRIETATSKLGLYGTGFIAGAAIVISTANNLWELTKSSATCWAVLLFAYCSLNVSAYVLQGHSVKTYRVRNRHKVLDAYTPSRALAVQYYAESLSLRHSAALLVSYIRNLDEWLVATIATGLLVSCLGSTLVSASSC